MLKETFSDVGSDGEFDHKFKLSVIKTNYETILSNSRHTLFNKH